MWRIAEEGNDRAAAEFDERYPQHRFELRKRMNMVQGLRKSNPAHSHEQLAPRFRPGPTPAASGGRSLAWGVGALALCTLAFAAYTASTFASKPKPLQLAPVVRANSEPLKSEPYNESLNPPPVVENPPSRPALELPPKTDATPAYLRPTSLKLEHEHLRKALEMVCSIGGLRAEIAPGFKDEVIDAEYKNATPLAIIQELGHKYAFTAFDQGDGSVLLIPAVDEMSRGKATQPANEQPH